MKRKLWLYMMVATLIGAAGFTASAQTANCPKANSTGICPADVATYRGSVQSVSMGPGQGHPSVVLRLDDGRDVTVRVGPYRLVAADGFAIAAGDRMEVRAFTSLRHDGLLVAVELKNLTTGKNLTLRDESGRPLAGGKGRRGGRGGQGPCRGGR